MKEITKNKETEPTKERLLTIVYNAICHIEEYGDKEIVKRVLEITEEEYQEITKMFDIRFC